MLEFTQNHSTDLQLIFEAILHREPIGFSRFADGERATIEGKRVRADGWVANNNKELSIEMSKAISFNHPQYYLGISCPCCDSRSNLFYRKKVQVPKSHVSYSTIFANGNADTAEYFLKNLLKEDIEIVGCRDESTIKIGPNMVSPLVDPTEILDKIEKSSKSIILLAAGPYSCILIYEYLKRNCKGKVMIDVGSALDGIFGRQTRQYHKSNHPYRKRICGNVI